MGSDDWRNSTDQNVYEMCVANGGPGFWIRRTTWGATCARIVGIGPMTKPGPYFGNPSVLMDVYSLVGELKEGLAQVPVPGTYKTWRRILAPPWAGQGDLRSLDDPAIDAGLQALDRKRHRASGKAQSEEERVFLSVPFSRKEEAKQLGARWSPAEKLWWLPASNEPALSQARALGFLPGNI
ncbi:MAG: hypothetical protein F9K19_03505 [Rhizobiaceae bacterium]|jgi:hypothetical protein|uniref:DUF5710 domain-containing protein n=1 Tax=Alphaproteobacteria TaxID=28211 RepID=UPI00101D741A|nr:MULTISPECIES: DUF5710 domain-containing protein [Alphaproteobacteria]KAB2957297.1 MAG: hypothetical protein F9K19_03505 [Rhizobiaceae bacterium]MCB1512594.1 hypothetical protein [Hyphomicrobiaceae bacterium]